MEGYSGALVSIIIPAYNAEKYIRECLDSCLLQQWENIEIIVIDDCSTDSTLKVLDRYSKWYNKIILIKNDKNIGEYAATNKALRLASGEFVTFLDCDDMLPRWSIRTRAQILIQHSYADVVYGSVACFDNRSLLELEENTGIREKHPFKAPKAGLMYRHRVFQIYGIFYEKAYLHADREFVIRLGIHRPNEDFVVKGRNPAVAINESLLPMAFYRQTNCLQKKKMKADTMEHEIFKRRVHELGNTGITTDNTEFLSENIH